MADLQITGLPALAEAGIQATDVAAVADISATETKKVTIKDLIAAGVALIDDADIPAAKVGTLGTNQVATAAIQANAITAAKIASGTITATEIADATITGTKLVNDTVTATQIAANAITASELADNAVDTAAIAANAVTTAKITDANVTYAKLSLSDGDIPGAKIATGGITATQLAANSVAASELSDDAVDTAAIVDGAVTAVKIATNTITANQIAANAIGASELADNAVDTAAIADGAVTAAKLSGTIAASSIADDAVTTAKILDDAVTSAKLAANAVDAAALADNAVDSGAIASNAVIEAKIAANAVVNAKIADGTITAAKLNTSNIDRSLNVASGNLGINNTVTAATRSGITYNAQGLITGTVALAAGDLPVATTSAVGGVSVSTGLTVSGAGALSLTNSVTGATVSGITFNNQGMITAATALTAANLPVATTSAKGAVQITSGGGLTVDGSGNLTTSTSGISAGTYQSITVNNKGIATAGAALTAGLIPDLAASKITSGSLDAARIGNDTIDGTKLSNTSTAIFQSIAQSGYPTAQFSGQILFDTVSEDAYIWDGNAWQAITTLTKGSLVFGGNFNANTSKMTACTSAGLAAGLAVGSNLPTASATVDGVYVVVDTAGTPSAPAPVVAFSPPDYILGVTNASGSSWNEIDLSQTVAGQVASNITFTHYGGLISTNVQDALQELETEKLALAGGTVTGQVLIGNTGSLVFEGSSIDAYQTIFAITNPTQADRTITFPDLSGTVITNGDTGTVTGTMLANGTIQNVDIHADAAIAFTKLADLTAAQILVGNASNEPTSVAVTGDISINNAGLVAITADSIVNADIKSDAAIAGSKIVAGTTSVVGVVQLVDSATSTSTTLAATGASVKVAKDAADAAATTANAAVEKSGSTMTGNLIIDNAKELRLSEADSDGAHFSGFKAQAQVADITYTLPASAPTTGQVLKAGSTATTLEWGSDSAIDASKMPLAGGTFTGDVTFTGDSSNGLWDKSQSAFVANLIGNVTGNVTGNTSGSAGSCTGNAATATALATARTIGGTSFDGTANIAVALAATATALATARNIGGVSFDGTAAIDLPGVNASGTQDTSGTAALATEFTVTANDSTDETVYPIFVDAATGSQGAETDTGLTYNPSSGLLTSTAFAGALTGNVTGNASGSAATVTGAAQSAITSLGTLTALVVNGNLGVGSSPSYGTSGQVLTSAGSGSAPTWADAAGGGSEVTLVADGAIAANKTCIIKSNGKAEQVEATITPTDPGSITASAEGTVNGNPTAQGQRLLYDPYSGLYLYFGRNSSNYQEIFRGKSGGANITPVEHGGSTGAWTPSAITGSGTGFIGTTKDCGLNPSHIEITSNNGWVAWLVKDQDGDGKTWIVTGKTTQDDDSDFDGKVAGHCHNVGTVADTRTTTAASLIYCGDDQLAVIYSDDSDGTKGYIRVGTVSSVTASGSTITWGTATKFSEGLLHMNGAACDIANKKIMILSRGGAASGNDSVINSVVITVDTDNSVSVGTWVTGIQTANFNNPTMLFDTNTNRFICCYYHDASGETYKGQFRVGSISGTTPSWGSEVEIHDERCYHMDMAYHEDIKRVAVAWADDDERRIRVKLAEISDSSNTCTVSANYKEINTYASSTKTTDTSVVYDTKDKHIVIGWAHGYTGLRVRTIDFGSAGSNATASNFLGFSDAAYADGANATIQVVGSVNTGQSGMTVGTKQYVQKDGTLATTAPSGLTIEAGISLSATNLLIKG